MILAVAPGLAPPPEEVVVVARRREESLQSVPLAVSVVSGKRLDDTNTVNTQQLAQLVPVLYYNSANPRNTAYTLRGLGSSTLAISAANDGIEAGVGFYVDGVYHARPATAAFDFTDIERVEVMRGPQGTLFGKNTTAGAIHVLSREPSFLPERRAELAYGERDFQQAKVAVSGGFSDRWAGRFSAQLTRRDGVIRQTTTGRRLNTLDNHALRAQLLFKPDEDFKLRVIADITSLDAVCCTQVYLRTGESRRSPARQFASLAAGLGYAPPSLNVYDRLSDIDADLGIDTQEGGLSLTADWRLAHGRLTSVTAWRYWQWDVANDRDFTGLPIQLVQRIPSRQDQVSQELRFAWEGTGRWRGIGGLYVFAQDIGGKPTSVYGPAAAYWLLNPESYRVPLPRDLLDGYSQTGESSFRMKSHALFGEFDYSITPRLTATLGLRYTVEHKQGHYATWVSGGLDLSGLPAATASELARAKLSIFRPQAYDTALQGSNMSGRMNLAFAPTERVLAFASYAHGYKSGGLNMSGLPLDAQNRPVLSTAIIEDELNRTLEFGLKTRWREDRLIANLALFRTRVRNYQANIVSSIETAALRSYPANIPEVQVRGGELDFDVRFGGGLRAQASVAYAAGRNTEYPAGPCPLEVQTAATIACDLTDQRLAGLSTWVGTMGIEYTRVVRGGQWILRADGVARSGYNADTSASRHTTIPGHALLNASIVFQATAGWEAGLFARNVLDRNHLTALTLQTGNSGLILGQPGDPRQVGIRVRMGF